MPDHHDPYLALRSPSYRRLLTANVLAATGTEMQSVAVGWELYNRTGSYTILGLVGLVQFIPVVLLSLPAGQAADRYSRKKLLAGSLTLLTLASSGLAALSFTKGPIPLVFLCLLFVGVSRALDAPARWALVPMVVPEGALHNAITWNSTGWQVASMSGPALGGLIIAAVGAEAWVYVLTAVSLLICAGLVATLQPRPSVRVVESLSWRSLLAGIAFVWRTRLILATITMDLFAVLLGGATALLPIYARDILHIGPTGLGWLRAAPSLGAFAMALTLAHLRLRRAGPTLLLSVAGFGVATIVFGLSTNPFLSFAMLAATGALDNISVVVRGTLVQTLTPDPMRGRVSAVNLIFISSSNELGAFESGVTADLFTPVRSVVGGGIGTILVVIAAMMLWPEILRLGPLHKVERVEPAETEGAVVLEAEQEEMTGAP